MEFAKKKLKRKKKTRKSWEYMQFCSFMEAGDFSGPECLNNKGGETESKYRNFGSTVFYTPAGTTGY